MSASRRRSIGCKFCKGFSLKRLELNGLRQPENGYTVFRLPQISLLKSRQA
ncbi:hypothetical protein GCWU000324_02720 [Kingella oralis ATCC 51147]|uniref:Uncharacterized protein n=1 Tax=Kingella oralis ATCC 51147 TaxID=629741 RepID=C4GLZ6_9NEIS|nr:hypothetical protein GCWU000324_02720 [Kingella oralis ATCC 51147]